MKVAIFGKKFQNNLVDFRTIVKKSLKENGAHSLDESYFKTSVDDDQNNPDKIFARIEKILFNTDVVIIEATERSDGIGIITGLTISLRKPLLLLYNEKKRKGVDTFSAVAKGSDITKRSTVRGYNKETIGQIISDFITESEDMIKAKFYINLPPDINRYLTWWANENGQPKVARLRELVKKDLENNKKWQGFTK